MTFDEYYKKEFEDKKRQSSLKQDHEKTWNAAIEHIRKKIATIPTREEILGGQRTKYVQLDEVIGWLDES
jgi:hypothetical protein